MENQWKKINQNKWTRKNDTIDIIKNMDISNDKILSYEVDIYLFSENHRHIIKTFKTENEAQQYININIMFSEEKETTLSFIKELEKQQQESDERFKALQKRIEGY